MTTTGSGITPEKQLSSKNKLLIIKNFQNNTQLTSF
jgi:hypothetical protein